MLILSAPSAWAHDSGFGLVRYEPDGTVDTSFGNSGSVVIRAAQRSFVANTLALQNDGKVVLAGLTSDIDTGTIQLALARYNPDGTPDAGFGSSGIVSTSVGDAGAQANSIAVQPDGKLVVAGTLYSRGGSDALLVARYTSDGAPDGRFGLSGISATPVGTAASSAAAVALQQDGRIVAVGTAFANAATDDDFALVRFTPDGQLDPTFGQNGVVITDLTPADAESPSLDHATAVALQPDGRIVVGGFTRGETQAFAVVRYTADGVPDSTFGARGLVKIPAREPQVSAITLLPSGALALAGSAASNERGTAPFALLRLRADGAPDTSFGQDGLVTTDFDGSRSGARAVAVQPNGRLVTGGAKFGAPSASGDALPESGFALARYNADGSLDRSFGTNGRATSKLGDAGAVPVALAVQPDGKIVAAGLVFFQVPTSPSQTVSMMPLALAATAALAGLLSVPLLLRRMRSHR
ncbi:MAG: hypothetical protein JO020_10940 [Chloroflexi bacterium]|nr:hypothetical protein [Chloroflexota bacterium]